METHFTVRCQSTARWYFDLSLSAQLLPASCAHNHWCPVCDQDVQFSLFRLLPTCCTATECCPVLWRIAYNCCRAHAAELEAESLYSGFHRTSPANCIYQVCSIWMDWCGICCLFTLFTFHISFATAISEANLSSIFQLFQSYGTESKYSSSQEAEFGQNESVI